jgi:hypothetical protein
MDYRAAVEAFLQPPPVDPPVPAVVAAASPARRLRDAAEPVAMHPVWSRGVNEALAGLGLNFLTGYVGGRAAALGEPVPAVVAAVFAWFEPGLITSLYDESRRAVSREALLAARDRTTVASLREALGDADVAPVADALRRGAAAADGTGRSLFTGLRDRPWPSEPLAQLWRGCDLLREHRGDSHVAAVLVTGLTPVQMNVLTELAVGMPMLSYTATRGWSQEAMDDAVAGLEERGWVAGAELTDAGRRGRQEIEERTDAQEQPVVDAVGPDLEAVVERLTEWGRRCVEAGSFPPDPRKRWAG